MPPIITRKGDGTYIASINGEGWEFSAKFGSYIAASDYLAQLGFGYGIVERNSRLENSRRIDPEFARMMRENRSTNL